MSVISTQLQASARAAYRDLLRAAALTFRGDEPVRNAFRAKMRSEIIPNTAAVTDPAMFEQKVTLARDIADVLRKNIVQARRVEHDGRAPDGDDRWKLRFTEHTELGSNDSIKNPPKNTGKYSSSAASADNATHSSVSIPGTSTSQSENAPAEDGVVRPAVPRYYSQLKKAHKERTVPELLEKDLEESFVRGSGPGGQSINKTENNVQLLHKPTGIRVSCQETRSLMQNRKIARKLLVEKLDKLQNPGLSKQQLQKARQIERERRRKNKAKKKAKKLAGEQDVGEDAGEDAGDDA